MTGLMKEAGSPAAFCTETLAVGENRVTTIEDAMMSSARYLMSSRPAGSSHMTNLADDYAGL